MAKRQGCLIHIIAFMPIAAAVHQGLPLFRDVELVGVELLALHSLGKQEDADRGAIPHDASNADSKTCVPGAISCEFLLQDRNSAPSGSSPIGQIWVLKFGAALLYYREETGVSHG
jgi:hypothetical protein